MEDYPQDLIFGRNEHASKSFVAHCLHPECQCQRRLVAHQSREQHVSLIFCDEVPIGIGPGSADKPCWMGVAQSYSLLYLVLFLAQMIRQPKRLV